MTPIDLFIMGEPAPGGSKKAFVQRDRAGKIVWRGENPVILIVDDGKHNAKWKRQVARQAKAQYTGPVIAHPVRAIFTFYLERPEDHYTAGHKRGLRPEYLDVLHKPTKPDGLKLRRSTEDALTGIVWVDDSLVVQGADEKLYRKPHEPCGCRIVIGDVVADHAAEGLWAGASA